MKMRLGALSATAAAAAAPCVWLAAYTNAQDAAGSMAQPGAGASDVTPREEGDGGGYAGSDASCGPSVLYNRTMDPSRYRFGCPEIALSNAVVVVPTEDGPAEVTFGHSYMHVGKRIVQKKRTVPTDLVHA